MESNYDDGDSEFESDFFDQIAVVPDQEETVQQSAFVKELLGGVKRKANAPVEDKSPTVIAEASPVVPAPAEAPSSGIEVPKYDIDSLKKYRKRSRPAPKKEAKPVDVSSLSFPSLKSHPDYATSAFLTPTQCIYPDDPRLCSGTLLRYLRVPDDGLVGLPRRGDYIPYSTLSAAAVAAATQADAATQAQPDSAPQELSGPSVDPPPRLVVSAGGAMLDAAQACIDGVELGHQHEEQEQGGWGVGGGQSGYADAEVLASLARQGIGRPEDVQAASSSSSSLSSSSSSSSSTADRWFPASLLPRLLLEASHRVFPRALVQELRPDAAWLRRGRRVLSGCEPVKVVLKQTRQRQPAAGAGPSELGLGFGLGADEGERRRVRVSLYGEWQTEALEDPAAAAPDAATTGTTPIPANRFGNVDLSGGGELPPGTVYLPHADKYAAQLRELGVATAPALVRWEARRGAAPEAVCEGLVLWAADAAVAEAVEEEVMGRDKRARRVMEFKRALSEWRAVALRLRDRRHAYLQAAKRLRGE